MEENKNKGNIIDIISIILIFFVFCGYFGHSLNIITYRLPVYILCAIAIVKIIVSIKNKDINKYKNNIKYCVWYGVFILYNMITLFWTIDIENSVELIKGMILTLMYIFGIYGYITNHKELDNVMKALLLGNLYMCIRLIFFETAEPWTDDFGNIVGLYFNRIAVSLANGIIIALYFFKKEKKYRYIFLIVIFYFVNYLTGSRKGLLMPIAFIGMFLVLNMGRDLKKIKRNILTIFAIILIIVPIAYNNTMIRTKIENLYKSVVTNETTKDGSIRERAYFRKTAMELFKQHPINGIGTNGFRVYLKNIKYRGSISYSHCNFTELLATLGVIGFLLYYIMYVLILKKSLHKYNSDNLDKVLPLSFIIVQTIFEYGFVSFYMFEFQITIALIFLISQEYDEHNKEMVSSKTKVVTIIPSLNTGGAERTAVAVANWMSNKSNIESYLINLGKNDNNYEINNNVILYNKYTGKGIIKKINAYIDTIQYLNSIKPDIIFEMLFSPIKYALINKIVNKEVIIIGSERNNPKKYKDLKHKFLCKYCPIICDGYIFQTEKVKEMFSKNIQKKSVVIGNAISNPEAYNIEMPKEKQKVIVNVGRLHDQKGQDTLIKAFSIVHKKYPEYKLQIYGEGPERINLEKLIKDLKLQENVYLLGVSKEKEIIEKISNAEIFIMTSRYEGMPNALLEAMAIGMPCISTNCVAGPSEIIENGKNGLLVEVDNVDEIANKLIYLIQNEEIRNKFSSEAKKIKDKYSAEKIYKDYYNYFMKIMIEKRNRGNLKKRIFMKLQQLGITNIIPDKMYLRILYKYRLNSNLNLKKPSTFNEKLQWLKLNDRKEQYTTMVDKYNVKKYVSDIIGEEYIIPTLGLYNNFEEIDFSKLPNQFVIKCTHDSGGLVICRDKKTFDIEYAKRKINQSLKNNFFYHNREWPYKDVKPRIIVEKYMQNGKEKFLRDYKFYCFNGIPKLLYVSEGMEEHSIAKISFFDMDFNFTHFGRNDYSRFEEKPKKPQNFEKMKELAMQLSEGMTFIRVDFYEINGKIYFSELTFTPCGGFMPFEPKEYDEKLGKMIQLPINEDKNLKVV